MRSAPLRSGITAELRHHATLDTSDVSLYCGRMKSTTRRNRKGTTSSASKAGKARWLPTQNTRAATFADRRALASKRACRGRVASDFA
jgi:hypothetical protein